MRVALVHSFYRSDAPSGENVVVLRQVEALKAAGHEVALVARYSDQEMQTPLYGLRSAACVATGFGPDPTEELRGFGPDIVHVHNLFPNFGERWLNKWDGPLVATLHNFRPICANSLLYRDGAVCTNCVGGNTLPALRHACYRASRIATLPLAVHNTGGARRNRLLQRADRVIVLSERSRRIFAEAAGQTVTARLVVVPNGLEDRSTGARPVPSYWAFVGRLSPEKGITELLRSWPDSERLIVAGDGPLRRDLESLASGGITFLGPVSEAEVDRLLAGAWGLVFPSRCPEGFPTVVAEAAMHGTPILARAGSSGADFVTGSGAGFSYGTDSELAERLQEVREDHLTLSVASRRAFETRLSLDAWTEALVSVYQQAMDRRESTIR